MKSPTRSRFTLIIGACILFISPLALAKDKIVFNLQQDPVTNPDNGVRPSHR
jgi:hypothetical protein